MTHIKEHERKRIMNNIKVGIIGCGWFANVHLDNLMTFEGVEVVAIVGTNRDKLIAIGKKVPDARLYNNHGDMFTQEEQLDAVYICVPPSCHGDAELIAASKGIHLYVEKPIELSMEKALSISKAIKKAGIISCVGYQERYNPELDYIKDYIKDKKIGIVSGRWIGDMPGVHWWREKVLSGGQIVEQSTHIVDMLRFLFGEVNSVYCSAIKGLIEDVPNYSVEDGSSTTLTFNSGVIATVFTACYVEDLSEYSGVGFQIICNDAVVDYLWDNKAIYTEKNEKRTHEFVRDSHLKASQTFIEAVKTNNSELIKSSYGDACKTLEITLAANESMKTKQAVFLK